jgi:hypothetical protein
LQEQLRAGDAGGEVDGELRGTDSQEEGEEGEEGSKLGYFSMLTNVSGGLELEKKYIKLSNYLLLFAFQPTNFNHG